MINVIVIQGRLTSDPTMHQSGSGVSRATFSVACDRDFKDKATGERATDFINCTAFRNTADFVSRYVTKGRMVIVKGRLQVRSYQDKDGNKRTATEIVAENVYPCDKRDPLDAAVNAYNKAPGTPAQFETIDDDGQLPF